MEYNNNSHPVEVKGINDLSALDCGLGPILDTSMFRPQVYCIVFSRYYLLWALCKLLQFCVELKDIPMD